MKKEFLLGILGLAVALLFITSCVPVVKYYECDDGTEVTDLDLCPKESEEPEEPEEPEVVEPDVPDEGPDEEEVVMGVFTEEARALFDKLENVKSMKYAYVVAPGVLPENIYFTSRTNMKIQLKSKVKFSPSDTYDTVYLDLVKKTAIAYCENTDREICPDRDKGYDVEFDDYFIETPYDWVAKLTGAELTGRSQRIENRNAQEVAFEINGESGTMYVDSFFGIPLEMNLAGLKYEFRDMATQINEDELEHQFET